MLDQVTRSETGVIEKEYKLDRVAGIAEWTYSVKLIKRLIVQATPNAKRG